MTIFGLKADIEANPDKDVQLFVPGQTKLESNDVFLGGPGTGITDDMIGSGTRVYGQTTEGTSRALSSYLKEQDPFSGNDIAAQIKAVVDANNVPRSDAYRGVPTLARQNFEASQIQNALANALAQKSYQHGVDQDNFNNTLSEAKLTGDYKGNPTLDKLAQKIQQQQFLANLNSDNYNKSADRAISQQNANTNEMSVTGVYPGSNSIPSEYSDWVNDAAQQNGLDPALVAGIIKVESGWNPSIVNSKSGATGLGQFLATTAADEGLTDRTDPKSSIYALAKYLRKRIDWAGGDINAGIKGYGEGTDEYLNKVLNATKSYSYGNISPKKQTESQRSDSATADAIEAIQRDAPNMTKEQFNNAITQIKSRWIRDGADMKVVQDAIDNAITQDEKEEVDAKAAAEANAKAYNATKHWWEASVK